MQENNKLLECLREIKPTVRDILDKREIITREFVSLFSKKNIKKIYFSGQASGIYVALMLKNFVENILHIEVSITNPFEFNEYEDFNVNSVYATEQLCLICPAHSGSTTGPIKMAEKCQKKGISVVCTTIDINSPLAHNSDVIIYKYCGNEESYIETKTHFASLVCLFLCFIDYAFFSNKISKIEYEKYIIQLSDSINNLDTVIEKTIAWYKENEKIFHNVNMIRYVAYGEFQGVALEGGLKIAETTHIACLYYELEEFMHRSTTQINDQSCIVIIGGQCQFTNRVHELISWCEQYSNKVIVISSNDDIIGRNILTIKSKDAPYFSVLEYLISLEVLAYCLSQTRNVSVIECTNDGASAMLHTHIS
ncbi:MAG: SIS domain-containing protein [Erysipelotrichia bacterium]|nr:SIS domain-containing protein [Erysipelotrichia bacterium]